MAYSRNICSLPQDCISKILSFTSPADACRIMAVSKEFQTPAESNVVWNKFLPHHILSLSTPPLMDFSSYMQLFFLLSNSILVDAGKKAFALERSTGKISYILSARDLSIPNNDDWTFKINQESRFGEVGELKAAERVEIEGKIRSQTLSPNTKYGAYLVFKMSENAYGLQSIPFETFVVGSGQHVLHTSTATLGDPESTKGGLQGLFYGNRLQKMKERVNGGDGDGGAATKREDRWLEIEIGEFFVRGDDEEEDEIRMGVMEIKGHQLKGGLILEGIDVRPKP